jgi:hypothetical protein
VTTWLEQSGARPLFAYQQIDHQHSTQPRRREHIKRPWRNDTPLHGRQSPHSQDSDPAFWFGCHTFVYLSEYSDVSP